MVYLNLKALHIIFVVTWFSGLFYIVRLFIYQTEALDKPDKEQEILFPHLTLMAKRLWLGITWPSAILTLIFGTSLIWANPVLLQLPFMRVKLALLLLLYTYHFVCHKQYSKLQQGNKWMSSNNLRLWNEVATLFLVSIVFLIILKNSVDWLYGTLGLVIFAVLLALAIRLYKKYRNS
ncbi:MAG: protoporphyrinogen IX oxidase [Cytophagales bacterium]|nr:protoporphyrinogen IX oxidase [Cytophagales bacterium]